MVENLFGGLMFFCFLSCYIPQIHEIVKNKNSQNVSALTYIITIFGYISGIIYLLVVKNYAIWLLLNYSLCMVLCFVILYYWHKYKS